MRDSCQRSGSAGSRVARLDGIRADTAETAREDIANAIASADGAGTHAQALVRAARDRRPEDAPATPAPARPKPGTPSGTAAAEGADRRLAQARYWKAQHGRYMACYLVS